MRTVDTDDPERTNQVAKVLQPGYRLGDRVLRPARVVVAGPKEEPSGDPA